ncbi:alanine--tRNA ligase [archaeon RBG_16_50_20]|nr:MAG: alanine--tRNA ligase [archaeon RBG_16_50_20]
MENEISEKEFAVPFFKENGFTRKQCECCKAYFWTQRPDEKYCGDSPCVQYSFIGKPPAKRPYSVHDMRELFLSFFEKNGHTRIKPYPVVARWRDDVFLVGASIYDFQPYVTEGQIPPPANPLVISQPSIRFTDIDNVGPTLGRHDLIFEMGGAHAFNYPGKEIYWMDQTIRYHHQLATEEFGLKSESLSYKEHFWSGGGNAGPDVECLCDGLEISTLVFMQYKVQGEELVKLPIRTVDTGYGIERWAWLSQGKPSAFQVIYGSVLDKIFDMASVKFDEKLVAKVVPVSSYMNTERGESRIDARKKMADALGMDWRELDKVLVPVENAMAVADHTKTIAFLLSECVVPSNVEEGYLARLLIRRTYRMLRQLGIEERILDILDLQVNYWGGDFPQLKDMRREIAEAIKSEESKYRRTIERGSDLVRKISSDLKAKGQKEIPSNTLVELYDSHGIVPDIVREIAEPMGVQVNEPGNFFGMVAQKHLSGKRASDEEGETEVAVSLKDKVAELPETVPLYYKDPFQKQFQGKALAVIDRKFVVLDQTCFYPEGGGQPGDIGVLQTSAGPVKVVDTQKAGRVILHQIDGKPPRVGDIVQGSIEWDRRVSLMRHHTGTHLVLGAARRVLGKHAWQAGAQKGVESSRIDISHYERITDEQVREIERLATETALQDIPVESMWLPREKAEQAYGYILYQGGVVPGRELRVIKIGDWDVEACGGTHCTRTGQIGAIKILHTERIQDGVERIIFAAGTQALRAFQEQERVLKGISSAVEAPVEKVDQYVQTLIEDRAKLTKRLEELGIQWAGQEAERLLRSSKKVGTVKLCQGKYTSGEENEIVSLNNKIVEEDPNAVTVLLLVKDSARVFVGAGKQAISHGVHAGKLAGKLAAIVGGGGGGKDYFGQGGGTNTKAADQIIKNSESVLKSMLTK